jgi:hypothetical protein
MNPLRRKATAVVHDRTTGTDREVVLYQWRLEVAVPLAVVATVVLLLVAVAGVKSFNRYQARADAANRARVTQLNIKTIAQQVKVQEQLANVKAAEAEGIRRAQDIVNRTLTPLYVQHEAVQAQLAMARSQNHTIIYVPAGTNGTPVITQSGSAEEVK